MSFPTLLALALIKPERFKVPAETLSPSPLSTGRDSPVNADSSTAVVPLTMMPSTGICSPGYTVKRSPSLTSSTETSVSCSPVRRCAFFGLKFIKLFKASVVLPLEIASSIFPKVIRVGIIAAVSKYRWWPSILVCSIFPSPKA